MKENYSFTEALKAIIKWKKLLLYVTLAAFVVSIIVSLLLPNYYKSTEIFYPYSLSSLDPKNIINPDHVVEIYGTSNDIERLKQIGQSEEIVDHMAKKYDLYKRYDIDTTETLAQYRLTQQFFENYKIVKNDLGALEVNVMDKDPLIASSMANEIVRYIDSINLVPIIEGNKRLMNTLKTTLDIKERDLLLVDSLTQYTVGKQEKIFSKITPKTIIQSQQAGDVNNRVMEKLFQLISLREKYSQMDLVSKNNVNSVFVIQKAVPAVKKAKPVRWIIVLASTIFAFFITIITIFLIEFYQNNLKVFLKNA